MWPSGRWSLENSRKAWRNGSRQRGTGLFLLVKNSWGWGWGEKEPAERGTKDPGKKIKNTQNKFINTGMGKYSLLWCKFYSENRKEIEFGKHSLRCLITC